MRKGFGNNLLVDDMTFALPPGGIVGIIGPNGAGKTTLFRMITGQEQPDSGTLRVGDTVTLAYVDQSRDVLDPEQTVWQMISGGSTKLCWAHARSTRARMFRVSTSPAPTSKRWWACFPAASATACIWPHAQGRRQCAAAGRTDQRPGREHDAALEEALENFAGCAVVISHDRWFLDRIATHILAFEGDSKVVFFDGNYTQYEEDRRQRLGIAADQPHRIKYRRLTR